MYIDIHTHKSLGSTELSIRNLTFAEAEILFSSDACGYFSVGIHPWQAAGFSLEQMQQLTAWSTDPRFVALGECGLDKYSEASFEVQLAAFEPQITLSENSKKPLIIHCVGCFNELLSLKKKFKPRQLWIIHGFRGKPELADQLLNAGCALSFGEHFNPESVRTTPLDRLFLETDESLLSIAEIYHTISGIKKCSMDELNAGYELIMAKSELWNQK